MGKEKGKPKGAMTAYACFVQVIREEHKKKHPEEQIVFSEFSKKCAEKWKTMSAKEKKRFEELAANDKQRYERENAQWQSTHVGAKGKKRKHLKDPNAPKRSISAFFFFCDEERPKVREIHPEWRVGDVAKELSKRWEACTNKPKYEALAAADKARYEREIAIYKAGGAKAGSSSPKKSKAD